jgi:succinylarginine dihydrolase
VWRWLEQMTAGNGPIRELFVVDVRQSMANGGGPACLRLRVVADPARVDPRFMADDARLDSSLASSPPLARAHRPQTCSRPSSGSRWRDARTRAVEALDLAELR